jgi:hypothetical protein
MAGDNAPVDLTTLGAVTPLPPPDHAIFAGPIKSASDGFPDLNMSREQMASKILALEYQVKKLCAHLGIDPNGY